MGCRRAGCELASLVLTVLVAAPCAAEGVPERRFEFLFETGPAFYRYEETGKRDFAGLETEWADVAARVTQEGRYRSPFDVTGLLRFSFLTSAEDTETNNVGSTPTDMRVAYFFELQPGAQYDWRPLPGLLVAPRFQWDLDWYLQERDTPGPGEVEESVFWHGPAPGFEVVAALGERWSAVVAYRHSFLIDVSASNSFADDLGFRDFSTDGERDVVAARIRRAFGERFGGSLGYGFESARIDASDTKSRTVSGPGGPQTIRIQFPENDHTIHAVTLSVDVRF